MSYSVLLQSLSLFAHYSCSNQALPLFNLQIYSLLMFYPHFSLLLVDWCSMRLCLQWFGFVVISQVSTFDTDVYTRELTCQETVKQRQLRERIQSCLTLFHSRPLWVEAHRYSYYQFRNQNCRFVKEVAQCLRVGVQLVLGDHRDEVRRLKS